MSYSYRNKAVPHDDRGGGEALGRHVRAEGAETEAVRGRPVLPAAGDIRHREQEPRH